MPESLPPEAAGLLERTRSLLDDDLLPMEHTLHLDADDPVPPEVIEWTRRRAREAGIFGLVQPAELGGLAAGPLARTAVREALAASGLRLAAYVVGPDPGLLAEAEGELRERYLLPVLSGERRGAFAFTEPQQASHPTHAHPDGDSFVVHGEKAYVTGGDDADFYVTVVRVEGVGEHPGGTAVLLIDRDLPGLHVAERFRSLDGSHHVSLHLHDVRIPRACLLGAVGEGLPRALRSIGATRLAVAAQASGWSLWTLAFLEQHLQAPHRSGTPLGERESIRLRYGDLRITAFAARSTLYRTARMTEAGARAINETMMTKVLCTEAAGRVIDSAIQLVGGRALVHGHPLEQLYRRVRALRLAEGASDLLRLQIARGRLELAKGTV